ncbi:MAG: endonuclease [Candidatus Cloacimonetes bacterium]|nr:endonuclease [Candidatus Cloacimonadota bacterium]
MMKKRNKIYQLYLELRDKYGPTEKFWPQWCAVKKTAKLRELIAIGAILTQRTSWHNADLALRNLKKHKLLSLQKIAEFLNLGQLTELISSAGFYQTKPKRLYDFCSFVVGEYENLENLMEEDLETARNKLLAINGIGPETADTILLYALDKPSFVIDEYTKRLVRKRNLAANFTRQINGLTYDYLKKLFEKNLPRDAKIYQDFHALIIVEEKGEAGSRMEKI